MKDSYRSILRRICRFERCFVYIIRLERKKTIDGKIYTLVYMSNYDNRTIMCRYIPYDSYDDYYDDYKSRKRLPFYAITINLDNDSYYRIDWEDVNLNKYDIKHLREIARTIDENGNEIPKKIRQYTIYEYYEPYVTIEQFLKKAVKEDDEYIEFILTDIEKYENNHSFNPTTEETISLLEYRNNFTPRRNTYVRTDDDYYEDSYYDNDYSTSYSDMTEEERVMYDLEHGNGEIHGY